MANFSVNVNFSFWNRNFYFFQLSQLFEYLFCRMRQNNDLFSAQSGHRVPKLLLITYYINCVVKFHQNCKWNRTRPFAFLMHAHTFVLFTIGLWNALPAVAMLNKVILDWTTKFQIQHRPRGLSVTAENLLYWAGWSSQVKTPILPNTFLHFLMFSLAVVKSQLLCSLN